jgi:hypothetical protein
MSALHPTLAFVAVLFAASSFKPAAVVRRVPLPAGFAPQAFAAADFDGDGGPDVALCGRSERFALLLGDGHGGMRATEQDARCGQHPSDMAAADLDGDGRIDLAVANHESDYLTILTNQRGAHFAARQIQVHSKPHPHMVAAADFNGDHAMDLVTDSWGEGRLTLLLASRPGAWQTPGTPIDAVRAPYVNVIAADFDADGHVDLAYPNASPGSGSDTVCVLFGDGKGGFQRSPQSPLRAGPAPFRIASGDVNNDGRPDIVVTSYSGHIADTSKDGLTWIRNDGARQFTAFPERVVNGRGAWTVGAGDLNGDGFADAAAIDAATNTVTLAFGSRAGLRAGPSIEVMPEPHHLVLADLDGDGRSEILVATEARDELAIAAVR